MSRTRRIYNRSPRITHLYMGDTGVLSYSHGWIILSGYGAYHAYATLCMGNCKWCRKSRENAKKYKLRRLADKRELRRTVRFDVEERYRDNPDFVRAESEERIAHQMCIVFCQQGWCGLEDENGVVTYRRIMEKRDDPCLGW